MRVDGYPGSDYLDPMTHPTTPCASCGSPIFDFEGRLYHEETTTQAPGEDLPVDLADHEAEAGES